MQKRKEANSYNLILKYTGLLGGVQGLNILVSLVRNKLVASILGPMGMGLISLYNATVKMISDTTGMGLSSSAVRELSEDGVTLQLDKVAMVRLWCLATALTGMVAGMLLSMPLSRFMFESDNYMWQIVCVAPLVATTAVTGGEMAILKSSRQLRSLAASSVTATFFVLLLTIPMYLLWHNNAIIPSLLLAGVAQLAVVLRYSLREYPYKIKVNKQVWRQGYGMLRLGAAFAVAGLLGGGAEFLLRSFVSREGGVAAVGLYNAGIVLTLTSAGLVFSAMDAYYFPQLSSYERTDRKFCGEVDRQIEINLLLISPIEYFFIILLPVVLPLLYSHKFDAAMPMTRFMALAMFIRAVALAVEYIPLSRGDSKGYLLCESVYDISLVAAVVAGYEMWDIMGCGVGILLASSLALAADLVYVGVRYGYRPQMRVVWLFVTLLLPAVAVCWLAFLPFSFIVLAWQLLLASVATGLSLWRLNKCTDMLSRLKNRIWRG